MSQRSEILNTPTGHRDLLPVPEVDATTPTSGLEVQTISDLTSNISAPWSLKHPNLASSLGSLGTTGLNLLLGPSVLEIWRVKVSRPELFTVTVGKTGIGTEMIFRIVRDLVEDHLDRCDQMSISLPVPEVWG